MEAQSLGAQPLPLVLERAASKAADLTAFDHLGTSALATLRNAYYVEVLLVY